MVIGRLNDKTILLFIVKFDVFLSVVDYCRIFAPSVNTDYLGMRGISYNDYAFTRQVIFMDDFVNFLDKNASAIDVIYVVFSR